MIFRCTCKASATVNTGESEALVKGCEQRTRSSNSLEKSSISLKEAEPSSFRKAPERPEATE